MITSFEAKEVLDQITLRLAVPSRRTPMRISVKMSRLKGENGVSWYIDMGRSNACSNDHFHSTPFQYTEAFTIADSVRVLNSDNIWPIKYTSFIPVIESIFRDTFEQHKDPRSEYRGWGHFHWCRRFVFFLREEP